jgi:hypothetical protein
MGKKILTEAISTLVAALLMTATGTYATYSTSGMIDIPTDEYLRHLQFEADVTMSFSGSETVSNYGCVKANLGLYGLAEFGLSVYSVYNSPAFVGNMKFEIIDEEHFWKYQPAVSVGLDNITNVTTLSAAGKRHTDDEAAYPEELYDRLSFFVVSTKNLPPLGTFHFGWGNGRFVGQGPYSEKFHGIFAGYQRKIYGPVEFMTEADGRDVNVGGRIKMGWMSFAVALEKAEQINRGFHPYFSLVFEVSNKSLHESTYERLELRRKVRTVHTRVIDLQSKIRVETTEINDLRNELEQLESEAESANVEMDKIEELQQELENLRETAGTEGETGTI